MGKYAKKVALGVVSLDAVVEEAFGDWQKSIQEIHIPAGEACKHLSGPARLKCVIRELIKRAAERVKAM